MSRNSGTSAGTASAATSGNPAEAIARAPRETCGRSAASTIGALPRAARIRLTVASMSGALSSSVPSRSNSTPRGNRDDGTEIDMKPRLSGTHAGPTTNHQRPPSPLDRTRQIIHIRPRPDPRRIPPRLVDQPAHVLQLQPGLAQPRGQLGGTDELAVAMGAGRQQARDVLGADDGQRERGRGAVEGRDEQAPAR